MVPSTCHNDSVFGRTVVATRPHSKCLVYNYAVRGSYPQKEFRVALMGGGSLSSSSLLRHKFCIRGMPFGPFMFRVECTASPISLAISFHWVYNYAQYYIHLAIVRINSVYYSLTAMLTWLFFVLLNLAHDQIHMHASLWNNPWWRWRYRDNAKLIQSTECQSSVRNTRPLKK